MTLKEFVYLLTCMAFTTVIGAGLHEHILVWPQWSAAPPVSFSMFQGEYGYDPRDFWPWLFPVVGLLSLLCLALFWNSRRRYILPVLGVYVLVMIATLTYFAPTAVATLEMGVGTEVDPVLKQKADLWEILSLMRILALIPPTFYLLWGLKAPERHVA